MTKTEKIKETLLQTKQKRQNQKPVTYQFKLQVKTKKRKTLLNKVFTEAKWLYNHILFNEIDRNPNTANKIFEVNVKVKDHLETRPITLLGSQVKQEIVSRLIDNIIGLKETRRNGNKTGTLKPKRYLNSIPLKQYGVTYKLDFSKNRVHIQKLGNFRILGLRQIPDNCEIASAVLLRKPNGFYIHVTTYQDKVRVSDTTKPVSIDFGIENKVFLSNGVSIDFEIPESQRLKRLQRKFSRTKKHSKNREKILWLLRKEYQKLSNIRKDCQNRVIGLLKHYDTVIYQNDAIKGWHEGFFGRQVQHSGIGSIKSRVSATLEPIVLSAKEPTTRECFMCSSKLDISLSDRVLVCNCGWRSHRDWNAALNMIKKGFDMDPNHILRLGWAKVTPVEWMTYARILDSPYIRVSHHDETGSSRIYS